MSVARARSVRPSAARRSIEASTVRPRHAGSMTLQATAGPLMEGHLRGEIGKAAVLDGFGITWELDTQVIRSRLKRVKRHPA